jgi:transcriptional regulator with XRE-family HTH domain
MEFSEDILTMDVGSRLRQLRSERGKSMRALARDSSLSTNALSMIERGRTSPSVSTLYKLADALEVPITAFFRLEPERQEVVFRKGSKRKKVQIPNGIWEGLGGEAFVGRLEAFMISLEPGATSGPFGMRHTGGEFVLCLEGQLEYEIEEDKYLLEPGDSLIFAAQLQHCWRNVGSVPVRVVIVVSGFELGERPSEFHIASQIQESISPEDV